MIALVDLVRYKHLPSLEEANITLKKVRTNLPWARPQR